MDDHGEIENAFSRELAKDMDKLMIEKLGNAFIKAIEQAQAEATAEQPMPKGSGPEIHALVAKDLEARARKGEATYGEKLKPFNGRDPLIDAYQEALDLCVYLKQELVERKAKAGPNEKYYVDSLL